VHRSFRLEPPEPRPDLLARPRLIRALLGRWGHRVTVLVGGPGLGKTTLLTQAVAENLMEPRGHDVWIGVEADDADEILLAQAVATALARPPDGEADVAPGGDGASGTGTGDTGTAASTGGRARPGGDGPGNAMPDFDPGDARPDADHGDGHGDGHGGRSRPAGPDIDLGEGHGARSGSAGPDMRGRELDDDADLSVAAVADAVWRRSPTEICLMFDDVHNLPEGSAGARWLADLLKALPANGHIVLTSRTEPPVPLARLRSQGMVLSLGEDDLLFTVDELDKLAAQRGVEPEQFGGTGGWPAVAELASHLDRRLLTGQYLWEEVLAPLGEDRRRLLAVLCDLGAADAELLSAALDRPIDLRAELQGVPLVTAAGSSGWYEPHALWRAAPELTLDPDDRATVRRRAVSQLSDRGHFDEAFRLLSQAELWDLAPAVLRAACLTSDRLTSNRLDRWLALCPEEVRSSSAGCLATGLHRSFTSPAEATAPLRSAVYQCRDAGDIDGELAAIAHLGRLAWWRQDVLALGPDLAIRMGELAITGHPQAVALTALGCAMVADLNGQDETVLMLLGTIQPGVLDLAWSAMAGWLEGVTRLDVGDTDAALRIVERFPPTSDPVLRTIHDALRLRTWWALGRVDDVVADIPGDLAQAQRAGVAYNLYVGLTEASLVYSYIGDVRAAAQCLDQATTVAPPRSGPDLPVRLAVATAALRLAEGDEDGATQVLRTAADRHGVDQGVDRRAWRQTLPLSYVLLPETRAHWDGLTLRGHLQVVRDLAAAVAAARESGGREHPLVHQLDVPRAPTVRAALHHRLAADLVVALHRAARPEAGTLLEALGPSGRAAVRAVASQRPRLAKPARALLAALPAPPARSTHVSALGPLAVHRDSCHGEEVTGQELRRRRVRELLAYLVGHRSTTRDALMAALWPDLDLHESSNNLAVTLNYLLRVLEPWRAPGEPAYLLRLEGQSVRLVVDDHLRIDVDEFDRQLAAAAVAEDDGTPSVALGHHLAAVALYRGPLCADLPETSWIALDREHYASRFVTAASRAAQLLLGRGDADQAEALARQAVEIDPGSAAAHAALVGAALARDDAAAARRRLAWCLESLADVGVEPSGAVRQLQRRLEQGDAGDLPAVSAPRTTREVTTREETASPPRAG
jgi:LuxR family transcriptional regulator, maltose regulon positive regulatory protein